MADIYTQILDVFGATATIIPAGDPRQENAAKTTFTTKPGASGLAATFTYSKASSLFVPSTQFTKNQHRIPILGMNGVDQQWDTPDDAYWTRGNGIADSPFSVGMFVDSKDNTDYQHLMGKFGASGAVREWLVQITDTGILDFRLYDPSVDITITRKSDAAVPQYKPTFLAATYDGTGGATAMNGVALYVDGVAIASTATNNASYVAMEDTTSVVTVGSRSDEVATSFITGRVWGGPLGAFFVQTALSAEILRQINVRYQSYIRGGFTDYRRLLRR